MATARTKQTHTERVEQIAEEAATKIAAASPYEEDVIVTIEEVSPSATRHTGDGRAALDPVLDSRFAPMRYMETLTAVGAAHSAYVQGIVGAHVKFAGRLADAVSPRTR